MPAAPAQTSPDVVYELRTLPRIGPVEFGDFVAAEANEREAIVRAAKYVRQAPRTRAWFARQRIEDYLTSPVRNGGDLEAARDMAARAMTDPGWTEHERADAEASHECLSMFIRNLNQLPIQGRDVLPVAEEQPPLLIGPLAVDLELSCLMRAAAPRGGPDLIGGLYLNTRKGKGLGQKEDTRLKRRKAGETVALLVFRRLLDAHSDLGEPAQEMAMHYYVRAGQIWTAPQAYVNRLRNLEADARMLASHWETVAPPPDFAAATVLRVD